MYWCNVLLTITISIVLYCHCLEQKSFMECLGSY